MTLMQRRRALMGVKRGASRLPAEYQEVQWIGRSKNGQYIITNFFSNTQNFTIHVKYLKDTQATGESALIFGKASDSASAAYEVGFTTVANRLFAFSSTSAQVVDPIVYGNINEIDITFSTTSPTCVITLKNGQTTLTGSKTGANASYIGNGKMWLFANQVGSLTCDGRIYELSVADSNGTLLYNGVPCYLKDTGSVGLYDTVGGQFATSIGVGMDKGPDVN